jgi:S-DNA-T family DNA segregation ATPase FtsK/SpoIIIE
MARLTGVQRVWEASMIIACVFAFFLLLALVSFHPGDPGWSQAGLQLDVHNWVGATGAWVADLLLFSFGFLAYLMPFGAAFLGWFLFQHIKSLDEFDYLTIGLRIIGGLLMALGATGIASINFDDIFNFSAGGFVGDVISSALVPYFNTAGTILLLLCFFCTGFTLLTGISWLTIVDRLGEMALWLLRKCVALPKQTMALQLPKLSLPSRTQQTNSSEFDITSMRAEPPAETPTPQSRDTHISAPNNDINNNDNKTGTVNDNETGTEKNADTHQNTPPAQDTHGRQRSEPTLGDFDELLDDEPPFSITPSTSHSDASPQQATKNGFSLSGLRDAVKSKVSADKTPTASDTTAEQTPSVSASDERPKVESEQGSVQSQVNKTPEPFQRAALGATAIDVQEGEGDEPVTPMPSFDLLERADKHENPLTQEEMDAISRLVEEKLADFNIEATVVGVYPGPVITRFELDLAPGVKVSKITGLSKDLARAMSAISVRVVEVIPGKSVIGLELPNKKREMVRLSEVISCDAFQSHQSPLTMVLGADISGKPVIVDLAKMPHLLVAGTTGSGKSVGVNVMILSLLYKSTPEDVRMIMIDPKMLELSVYEGIPHLLAEVVTDMKEAANALRWCVGEMERRYRLMSALGVRNLKGYNAKVTEAIAQGEPIKDPLWKSEESMETEAPDLEKLPAIVVVVDEFADMMMIVGKKVEELIARIAQKARAAGIHLVLATQRPSVDVITGLIKANIPTRIAFQVSSKIDSRTILDQQGAETLLGMGDMLYLPPGSPVPTRVHGAFVDDHEVHAVVADWKRRGQPKYIDEILNGEASAEVLLPGEQPDGEDQEFDAFYDEAVAFVTETRRASVSSVQRKFRIGYNRAARLVEQMEASGVVSAQGHNGNREVIAPPPVKE